MIAVSISNLLKQKQHIAIASHVMPDGDSIGSMLALYSALKKMGKIVDVYVSDNAPERYSFLPCFDCIKVPDKNDRQIYDVFVVLDCGSFDRTGLCQDIIKESGISINIDHHGTNCLFADLNLVDTNASATGELVYQIIKLMGVEISKEEAMCIYTAILTDTGGFRYSNTTSITHQIAGELINTGIDFNSIYDMIYRSFKYEDIKLLGSALGSLQLFCNGKIAYMQILQKDIEKLGLEVTDTSDFIDYARDINTVEVAIFAKETVEKEFKLSFRSKKIIDVKSICEKYGGGGHVRAAGCTIKDSFDKVKSEIIEDLESKLKDGSV